jgi:hypothetical protein
MTQHAYRLCKGYLTKKESDGVQHQMTWPPQSPDILHLHLSFSRRSYPIEMVWDELDCRVKKSSPAYMGTPSKLLEKQKSWLRECQVYKAVIKAKGGYFEEPQI